MKRLYYIFLILFRYPTALLHEILHYTMCIIFDSGPEIKMNVSFEKLTFRPVVNYKNTGYRYKEILICTSPLLGIIIPIILSLTTFNIYIIIFTIYQLINIKIAFMSYIDINLLKKHLKKSENLLEFEI